MGYEKTITCPACGAKYELFEHKLTMRDKDSIECENCGEQLIRWNGAVMYSIKKIDRINADENK